MVIRINFWEQYITTRKEQKLEINIMNKWKLSAISLVFSGIEQTANDEVPVIL